MCGIFGWSLKPDAEPAPMRTVGAVLASLNAERGEHSWGVHAHGETHKGLKTIASAGARLGSIFGSASVLIGHTRYATTGAHTLGNAHPFHIGGLVGAHNGIVYNHEWLDRMYGRACAVDSMHLFHHLAAGLSLLDIETYGAIEWIDSEAPEAVNLACFHGGELAIADTEVGIVWSSDHLHLDTALSWGGLEYREFDIREGRIYSACNGELFGLQKIKVGKRKASTWPIKWDSARDVAAKGKSEADRLPSSADIEAAWQEWEAEQERLELEEIELNRGWDDAIARNF